MMYYMGIPEYGMKLVRAIQELKQKILVSNGERYRKQTPCRGAVTFTYSPFLRLRLSRATLKFRSLGRTVGQFVILNFARLPLLSFSTLVDFHFGFLPFWSSSFLVLFDFGPLQFWSSSILVIFKFGHLPFWLSSILIVFCFGHLTLWLTLSNQCQKIMFFN